MFTRRLRQDKVVACIKHRPLKATEAFQRFDFLGHNVKKPAFRRALLNPFCFGLTTPARAPAAHASIAASVSRHDRAADVAAWGVAHVYQVFHGVGGVVDAAISDTDRAASF